MYQLILCGFDFEASMEIIHEEVNKALKAEEQLQSEFLNTGIFRSDCMTVHIRRGKAVTGGYIRKGTADKILALTAVEAVRNLEWLRPGGEIEINEKPGSSLYDEEYPVSEMFRYITKTIL